MPSPAVRPRSRSKAKAKAKAKGKAKAKAKSAGSKKPAAAPAEPEESDAPEESGAPSELEAGGAPEESGAPSEPKKSAAPNRSPKGKPLRRKRARMLRSMSRRRITCSVTSTSKKGATSGKTGKRGKVAKHEPGEEDVANATQHYEEGEEAWDDQDEESWAAPADGVIAGRVDRKRAGEASEATVPAKRARKSKVKEFVEPATEEEEEKPEADPEEERKTFARRTCAERGWNRARWEGLRDAYNAKIRCFVVGHSKLEDLSTFVSCAGSCCMRFLRSGRAL